MNSLQNIFYRFKTTPHIVNNTYIMLFGSPYNIAYKKRVLGRLQLLIHIFMHAYYSAMGRSFFH